MQRVLRDPGKTDLFYGFDNLARSINTEGSEVEAHSVMIYQHLLVVAEAIGVKPRGIQKSPRPDAHCQASRSCLR